MRIKTLLFLSILTIFTVCKDSKEPTAESKPTDATPTKKEGAYKAVSQAECQNFQEKLEKALNVKFKLTPEEASSFPEGTVCKLEAKGSGSEIDYNTASEKIEKTIGWETDNRFAAGGPNGMGGGLKNGKNLIVYVVETEGSEDGKNKGTVSITISITQEN